MVTEEVSVVDRAANRRKFLIVKREGKEMTAGAQVVAGPNGLTTSPAGGVSGAPAASPTIKAAATLTKDAQSALKDALEEIMETLDDASKLVDSAKIVDDEQEMDASSIIDPLTEASEGLEDICYAFTGVQEPEEAAGEGGESAQAPAQQPNQPGAPMAMGYGKRLEVHRAKRVIQKADIVKQIAGLVGVAKYGRKLKKEREVRLQNAVAQLSSILAEIQGGGAVVDKAGAPPPPAPDKGKPKKPPVAGETQGPSTPNTPPAAMAPAGDGKPGKPVPGKKPPPPSPAAKVDDAELPAPVKKRFDDMQATITSLQVQLKKRAEDDAAQRGNIQQPNARQPEGQRAEPVDISWPLDMNSAPDDETSKNFFGG